MEFKRATFQIGTAMDIGHGTQGRWERELQTLVDPFSGCFLLKGVTPNGGFNSSFDALCWRPLRYEQLLLHAVGQVVREAEEEVEEADEGGGEGGEGGEGEEGEKGQGEGEEKEKEKEEKGSSSRGRCIPQEEERRTRSRL